MPHIEINGEKLHYAHTDKGSSKNLVLIHGSGGDYTCWPLSELETTGTNVYSIDLPGHGQSDGSARIDVTDYAAVVTAFVEALGLSGVYVAGHSLGGGIALTIGIAAPSWLSGLILVATGARLRVNPMIFEALNKDPKGAVSMMDSVIFSPDAPVEAKAAMRALGERTDPSVSIADFTACDKFDVMKELGRITVPCLVISGGADVLTSVKYGKFLAEGIADAELVIIEGAGHMLALEKPAEFVNALMRFLG